jgi:hypothetical protein
VLEVALHITEAAAVAVLDMSQALLFQLQRVKHLP